MTKTGIEVGQVAPEFALPDQDDVRVALSELRGHWVVLYFYPKDDTPGCTTEACEFTEGIEAFRGLDAIILGCSPDSPERHRKFIAKHGLEVRLLSDPDHEVMERYGAWGEKVLYGRTSVGVPKGRIAHHWKRVKAKGHAEKVRERLEAFHDA